MLIANTRARKRPAISVSEKGQEIISYKTISFNETQVQTQKPFSTLDIGKLINISAGISFQMKNKKRLVVEPYYKYPLGTLTIEKVRLGYGGINLRLNFHFSDLTK